MLSLETSEELRKEKISFFNKHIDFINNFLPSKIKNYIFTFLNSTENAHFSLDENDIRELQTINCNKELLYSIIYVCYRTIDYRWYDLFHYIPKKTCNNVDYYKESFLFKEQDTPYDIRQCRPDKKKYTYDAITNIGLYNRNQNFSYSCYTHKDAQAYLQKELGSKVLNSFNKLTIPQSQADFFLIASLYANGGISADVCSVAQSNVEILIRDCDFFLVYDQYGVSKKFIFTQKHNKFIEYYLYVLINKLDRFNDDSNYKLFSSRTVFHNAFLDFFAFNYHELDTSKISFLHDNIFNSFVRADGLEENLSGHIDFPKTSLKGIFKQNFLTKLYPSDAIVSSTDNFYMPPSNNLIVTGKNRNESLLQRIRTPYSLSSLDVYMAKNVSLSGHAGLWKNNKFLDFESYLSNVAENETRGGFWKVPNIDNITRTIDEECIVAFSAGYGCYGHYLVDDLPRLGLIKDYLGNEFKNKKLIISHRTAEWAKNLLKFFLGISDDNFLVFNHEQEVWNLRNVFLSSFPHKEYNFHPYIREFYTRFSQREVKPFRKICLSRKAWEKSKTHQRIFESQNIFEDMAVSRGFELVSPETMSLEDQIRLMSETACQIGEHGSGQHASIYNYYGNMVVGTINPLNEVQSNLGRIYNDKNIVCYADQHYTDEHHNLHYDVHHHHLLQFFNKIEEYSNF